MLTAIFLAAVLAGGPLPQVPPAHPDICRDTADCRAQALAARAAHEYERFHDLAWRAVQKGKPNDPELMYLLSRAQSLSGRPDDSLVMLGRLADQGVVADAETNPDFARVRAMPGWPDLEARLHALGPPTLTSPDEPSPPSADSAGSSPSGAPPAGAAAPSAEPSSAPPPSAGAPNAPANAPTARAAPTGPPAVSAGSAETASSPDAPSAAAPAPEGPAFDPSAIAPIGLAHDEVSRRFVLGDRNAARLVIVDDLSHHVVTLVSKDAGFYDHITGFTIDDQRGDLWVTSTNGDAAAARSRLHKLQLVSGRVLEQIEAPALVRLVDVAVAPDGTVYGLDGAGGRLLKLRPGAKSMDVVMPIAGGLPAAIAAAGERLYVATAAGIVGINPSARSSSVLRSSQTLAGIQALAWRRDEIVAVQHRDTGPALILLSLDRSGLRVTRVRVLGPAADQSPVTIAGRRVYYVPAPGVIGHVDLK